MKRSDVFKSKYLKAADVPPEGISWTIRDCIEEEVGKERTTKPALYFKEDSRALVLNLTNWRTLEGLYGDDSDDWVGCRVELYVIETELNGEPRAGIRLRTPFDNNSERPGGDSIPF